MDTEENFELSKALTSTEIQKKNWYENVQPDTTHFVENTISNEEESKTFFILYDLLP